MPAGAPPAASENIAHLGGQPNNLAEGFQIEKTTSELGGVAL